MESKRFLLIVLMITGAMLIFSSIGISDSAAQLKKMVKQPAAQAPALKESNVPQAQKIYSFAIETIGLTSQCQLKFILKNTGADLTADQHKNSHVRIGQNSPRSLASLDPGGRLKTRGQTHTYIENEPLTADTQISIEVTLFTGARISKQQLLQPACQIPKSITPQATIGQVGSKTESPFSPTGKTMSTKQKSVVTGALPQPETMIKTHLQVKRLGGDLETWANHGATDTSVQRLDFRWKTSLDPVHAARWEAAISPDFPYVIAQGGITPLPPKNAYGYFSIDLGGFSGAYTKPATFYIRVKPVKRNTPTATVPGSTSAPPSETTEYDPSSPVKITLTEAGSGEQTQFNLPQTHLKVVFEKILLIEDSDEMSGGDLHFRFAVHNLEKQIDFADGKYENGNMIPLSNISFIVTDPPDLVGFSVQGCDNDDMEAPAVGERLYAPDYASQCGDDPDTADVLYQIPTGTKSGKIKIPKTPFSLYANGAMLKYEVHGYYEMYCDPCP